MLLVRESRAAHPPRARGDINSGCELADDYSEVPPATANA